jgi:hypothetical protein
VDRRGAGGRSGSSLDDVGRSLHVIPVPIWIYSGWSVWYRLFIRPIVPNIEAIPRGGETYYEDFLLATDNGTRVDFRYDVGFDLIEPPRA